MPSSDAHGNDHNEDRVRHRRLDLLAKLKVLLKEHRQPFERVVEHTTNLARAHQTHGQFAEDPRVLRHRLRERRTTLDLGLNVADDLLEAHVRRLLLQNVETADQRDTGVDHRGELATEDREILQPDALAEAEAELLLRRLLRQRRGLLLLDTRREEALIAQ